MNAKLTRALEQAVFDWIREDAPVTIKMSITRDHTAKLIKRLNDAVVDLTLDYRSSDEDEKHLS